MEDAMESDVVLVVPPSVEDSEPSMVGDDNPLGITSRPSESSDASFSCFQLSGRGVESQSESSESLHIDDGAADIIPSSPGVMHIDLASTPTTTSSLPGRSTTSGSQELCTSTDLDSGRMSPELIPSSDVSSVDMMSSNPQSHTSSSLSPKDGEYSKDSKTKSHRHHDEDPFEIDTESYTPSKFLMTTEKEQDQAPSSYTFLQKLSCRDSQPPVILTASTQEDSENVVGSGERTERKAEEFDIDSKEIMIKDVEMRSMEEDSSPKNELNNGESNPPSPPEAEDSQAYTQEDLNLHLTFESQLFGATSLPNTDSQALVIDEQSETHNPPDVSTDSFQNETDLEKHKNANSRAEDLPQRDNDVTVCEEEIRDKSLPHSISQELFHAEPEMAQSSENCTSERQETTDKNQSCDKSDIDSTILPPSVTPPRTAEQEELGKPNKNLAISVSASIAIAESSNSEASSRDRSQNLTKDSTSYGQSDLASVDEKSLQDPSVLTSVSENKVAMTTESVPLDKLSSPAQTGADEVSPSMQSTYVDENNNQPPSQPSQSNIDTSNDSTGTDNQSASTETDKRLTHADKNNKAASQPNIAAVNESLESAMSSQPSLMSYDASVESSSLESAADMMAVPLGDLETQPYFSSAKKETTELKGDFQDSIVGQTSQPSEYPELTGGSAEKEVELLVSELIEQALAVPAKEPSPVTEQTVDIHELLGSKDKGQSSDAKDIETGREHLGKSYDFRSQSQPSQDIHLKSPFRSPTKPPVRERSGSVRKRSERRRSKTRMEKNQSNYADTDYENKQTEELDKSSDTLPPDDGSGQDSSDPLISPSKEGQLKYRVSKTTVVETICDGKVIETRTLPKKVKILTHNPYPPTSSQSSNGSGYLADTSSISRTSSDSSTQTMSSHSPGSKSRRTSMPSLLRDSSGSSSTSSSSASSTFAVPGHPLKAVRSPKEQDRQPSTSSPCEKAVSPIVPSSSPTSTSTTPAQSFSMWSPPLKKSMVLLTPLSEELIAASTGTMGSNFSVDIATPPATKINPLSGSTPVETPQKESDIETSSNSPEIPYPNDSPQGTLYKFDKTRSPGRKKSPKKSQIDKDQSADNKKSPRKRKVNKTIVTEEKKSPRPNTENKDTHDRLSFGEGIPVMARPSTETFFYPAMMRAQDPTSGKYCVVFEDDGKEKMIRESDVLLIDNLDVGQEVCVQSDSDDLSTWYSAGKIISFWRENDERGYVVEKSDPVLNKKEGRRYSRKSVIVRQDRLTQEQKLSRVHPMLTVTFDVSLDNIVNGKRRTRKSRFDSPGTSSAASSEPNTPSPNPSKTPKSSRKRRISDSQSSGSSSCVPFPSTKKPKRSKLTYGSKTSSKKQSSLPTKAQTTYKESKIFENCTFLLTSSTGRDQPSSEFDSPPADPAPGYDRVDIRKKIIAGRGKVVKSFTELMSSDRDHRFVISDYFCRTMNYLSALGAGVDCLSYVFIIDSTNLGELKPAGSYRLLAGYSLHQRCVVERPTVHKQPLSGLRIHLQMKDIMTWSPLLVLAGCETVSSRQNALKDECPLTCDVVVADSSCSTALKERADLLKIPVVSIEWIVQCLITSEKLPFDGHPLYTSLE